MLFALAALAGSTVFSLRGQQQDAVDTAATQRYNAKVMRANAVASRAMGEYNAKMAEKESRYQQLQERRKFNREQSRRRLLFATSGMRSDTGSPLESLSNAAADQEMNQAAIKWSGDARASQARFQGESGARNFEARASMADASARSTMANLSWQLAGTLLGAGAKAFSMDWGGATKKQPTKTDGGFLKTQGGSYGSMDWGR